MLLVLTAVIWGVAFVAQSEGSNYVGSNTFIGLRSLLAAAVLLPVILLSKKQGDSRKGVWRDGMLCGVLLFGASLAQQEGIAMGASAGKAGFLTAIYIVLVPLIHRFLFKRKTSPTIWLGVALALVGLYLLCVHESFTFQLPDLLLLLCALLFSFQILAVDRFSPHYDPIRLAAIQFLTCGVLGSLLMIPCDIAPVGLRAWAETLAIPGAWISIGYAAVFSSALGYTFQIVSQRDLNPTVASLIMSLESVFAALAGWLILRQVMSPREMLGSALVFAAILLAQIPPKKS